METEGIRRGDFAVKIKNSTPIENETACPAGNGTGCGYRVEARVNYSESKIIGGIIFDNRWRQIPWTETIRKGIPRPAYSRPELALAHLLTRHEAEAHRWWFICIAEAGEMCGALCLETRIVEYTVNYSYDATKTTYLDAFDGRADLPTDMEPKEEPND